MQKHQIIVIWGGEAFENQDDYLKSLQSYQLDINEKHKSWKWWLLSGLSDTFEWIRVNMPDTQNSFYPAWKIWFEKYFQYIGNEKLILIGHSLGGIFLTKYLSENTFPRNIDFLHLISPVFDNTGLQWASTASFEINPKKLEYIPTQVWEIHLWHSKDDPIVPFVHSEKYYNKLKNSILHTFENRGHFSHQPHFVELFLEIQKQI